jgi:hypothetical protein
MVARVGAAVSAATAMGLGAPWVTTGSMTTGSGSDGRQPGAMSEAEKAERLGLRARTAGCRSGPAPPRRTYVVDTQGIVRFAFIHADYTRRADPDAVVAALRDVVTAGHPG